MAKVGRPLIYETSEEMQEKIEEYFEMCNTYEVIDEEKDLYKQKPYTVSGLCIYLGMTRETLSQYEKREEFTDTIKRAKLVIENNIEERALTGKSDRVVSIFNLKNNFGWVDKIDNAHTIENKEITVSITDDPSL